MKVNDALLDYLFEGQAHMLRSVIASWFETSRRYVAFVADNRDKIRKKLRLNNDPDALEDLRWELEAAYLLHLDKRFTLMYEPYTSGQPFGPDYAVTYTTSLAFDIEVTRVRVMDDDGVRRVIDAVYGKLSQLSPNTSNVVAVGTAQGVDAAMFADEMKQMQRRVEARDLALLTRHGFRDPAHFFKYYERLGLVIVRSNAAPTLWTNTAAKLPLANKAVTALRQCFG